MAKTSPNYENKTPLFNFLQKCVTYVITSSKRCHFVSLRQELRWKFH